MTVGRQYLLVKPPGPSRPKVFLDQRVVPFAIDVAGSCEVAVQRLSQATGVRPATLVGAAAGAVLVLTALAFRRRVHARGSGS